MPALVASPSLLRQSLSTLATLYSFSMTTGGSGESLVIRMSGRRLDVASVPSFSSATVHWVPLTHSLMMVAIRPLSWSSLIDIFSAPDCLWSGL